MDPQDLKEIKEILLEKRRELLSQMGDIIDSERDASTREASGDNSGYSYHLADAGTDSMEREKNFLYAQRDGDMLYEVDQALERMEKGVYGICISCEEPINIERLKYLPETQSCIGCKAKTEETRNQVMSYDFNEEEWD